MGDTGEQKEIFVHGGLAKIKAFGLSQWLN